MINNVTIRSTVPSKSKFNGPWNETFIGGVNLWDAAFGFSVLFLMASEELAQLGHRKGQLENRMKRCPLASNRAFRRSTGSQGDLLSRHRVGRIRDILRCTWLYPMVTVESLGRADVGSRLFSRYPLLCRLGETLSTFVSRGELLARA